MYITVFGQFIMLGAGGRTRTGTEFTPKDFKSFASANSAHFGSKNKP